MAFSTTAFYGCKGQTVAVIPLPGDVSDCDYSDLEDEEYIPVTNNANNLVCNSSSDEDDQLQDNDKNDQQ